MEKNQSLDILGNVLTALEVLKSILYLVDVGPFKLCSLNEALRSHVHQVKLKTEICAANSNSKYPFAEIKIRNFLRQTVYQKPTDIPPGGARTRTELREGEDRAESKSGVCG